MTEEQLKEIEARVATAVAGARTWVSRGTSVTTDGRSPVASCASLGVAEFLVHGREDMPTLVAEVRRLRSLLATHAFKAGGSDDVNLCIGCDVGADEPAHAADCQVARELGLRLGNWVWRRGRREPVESIDG